MPKAREMLLRGGTGLGIVLVGAFAVVAASVVHPDATQSSTPDTTVKIDVDTSEVLLACPPMLIDPVDYTKELGKSFTVSSTKSELQSLAGGGDFVDLGEIRAGASLPEVIAGSAISGAEWNALEITQCLRPQNRQILMGGSVAPGEDTFIILVNPSDQPVSVAIGGLSAHGELGSVPQSIVVPAHTTQTWRPSIWYDDEDRLAITVRASGIGIAAWLQNSVMEGEVPQGIASAPGVAPSTSLNFPVVSPKSTLQIANPNSEATKVAVNLVEKEGSRPLGGTEDLVVDAGAVFSVNLEGIPEGGINVTSEAPVGAALVQSEIGAAHAVAKTQNIGTRSLSAPAVVAANPWVPPLEEFEEGLKKDGLTDIEFSLKSITPGDDGSKYGELDAKEWSGKRLRVDDASFTLQIKAQAKGGPVSADLPIGSYPTELLERNVTLIP